MANIDMMQPEESISRLDTHPIFRPEFKSGETPSLPNIFEG